MNTKHFNSCKICSLPETKMMYVVIYDTTALKQTISYIITNILTTPDASLNQFQTD